MSEGVPEPKAPAYSSHGKSDSSSSLQSRTLPPIQDAIHSASAPTTASSPLIRSQTVTSPPEQRGSRPIGVQNLLNPAGQEFASLPPARVFSSYAESPPTPSSLGPNSPRGTPAISNPSVSTRSPIDAAISRATPPSMGAFNVPLDRSMTPRSPTTWPKTKISHGHPTGTIDARRTPFLGSEPGQQSMAEVAHGSSLPGRTLAPVPSAMSSPSHPGGQGPMSQPVRSFERPEAGPPSQNLPPQHGANRDSPYAYPAAQQSDHTTLPPLAAPGPPPPSYFSSPYASSGPPSASRLKGFEIPTSDALAQSQFQMITMNTDSGPVQIPVDVQAASKVADEKRKRNATASHRFRQRRKEKERETSDNIARLEAQIRDVSEEKDYYQKERDYLQDLLLRNRIGLPARPPSPRRRRHKSMGGIMTSPYGEGDADDRSGRQMRRRTSAYMPPSGSAPSPAETPSNLPPQLERMAVMPPEQGHLAGQYPPASSYPPTSGPYSRPGPPR